MKFPTNATQYNRILANASFQLELSKVQGTWYLVGPDAAHADDACTYCASLNQLTPASLLHDATLIRASSRANAPTVEA